MNLYEIDKNIQEIIENGFTFNEETGEVIFEVKDLDKLNEMKEEKINSIVGYIKNLDLEIDSFKNVIDGYKKRLDQKKKKKEELINYLDLSIKKSGDLEKKEYKNGIVSYRKSKSLDIEEQNESKLIEWLEKNKNSEGFKTEKKIDKKVITQFINDGEKIPYAKIIENQNIQIK